MRRSAIGLLLPRAIGFLVVPLLAEAQQPPTLPRRGCVCTPPLAASSPRLEACRQGLRALGAVEGKNLVIEDRSAAGKPAQLAGLAAALGHRKGDRIVSSGPTATPAAKAATSPMPIGMGLARDPVANGGGTSRARPGGHLPGWSTLYPAIRGNQLARLTELVPQLARVAVFGAAVTSGDAQAKKEAELAAAALGLRLQYLAGRSPADMETGLQAASQEPADAILALPVPAFIAQRRLGTEVAATSRLPAIDDATAFVEDGGLRSYGVSMPDLFRRAATYVDKLLQGAQPAELPGEQPMKFELVLNLKTAKALGLTMPPSMLFHADEVIR